MQKPVVIVGAGVSGLVCARRLHQAGIPVLLIEATGELGGRIQTDEVDGFRLDRGFQVFFSAYPNARLELNYDKLGLKKFEPGCLVWDGKQQREVHRENILQTVFSKWVPIPDLLRFNQLTMDLAKMSVDEIWAMEDQSIRDFLGLRNVSKEAIERFIEPFFGGVFLDRSLEGSCRPFAYYWKMMNQGDTTVPALGMGEITKQIAADLPDGIIRRNTKVTGLVKKDESVSGVVLANGEKIDASHVVLATEAHVARELSGVPISVEMRSCTTVHFSAGSKPVMEPILLVNGLGRGEINHVACMTATSKALAPAGRHLISATKLGIPRTDDVTFAKSVRYELESWFPKSDVSGWIPLRVDRIEHAQLAQPVGFLENRPPMNPCDGLLLAGEYVTFVGIDGAIKSGQDAAIAVLQRVKEPVTQ